MWHPFLTWMPHAHGADWVHWPSIIKSFDRSTSWGSALKGRGIWNAWMECNYKISLHTFELFCDVDVQCNTTNSNSQGKQKIGGIKLNVVCVLLISHLRNYFTFPAINSHFFNFRLFYKSLFTSFLYLVKLYVFYFHKCYHIQLCSDILTLIKQHFY